MSQTYPVDASQQDAQPPTRNERSHIYCPVCRAITEKQLCFLKGTDYSRRYSDPLDVLCGDCHTIISTEYNYRPLQ
jgi:hypothetical protein